jgi:soluble lytic murein transglycosylase-like protein
VQGFKNIALQAGAMILGFDSIRGFISLLGSLNSNEAGLGRLAQNLNINVGELNTWGLAAERIGGKAEDVQGSFANLSKSLTDLNVNGTVSPLILLMQRLGIETRGVTDKTAKLLELGDKLRDYAKLHGRDNAFNISGLDATTFNLITADNSRELLAQAAKQNAINAETAKQAEANQAKMEKIKQRGKAIATDIGHNVTGPVLEAVDQSMTATGFQLEALNAAAHGDFTKALSLLKSSTQAVGGVVLDRKELDAGIARSEQHYGLPAGLLQAIAQRESGFQPAVIEGVQKSKNGNVGLMQLDPKIWKDAGLDTMRDIDHAAEEIRTLAKHYGGDYVKAAEAYNFGRGRLDAFLAGRPDPKTGKVLSQLPKETRDYGAAIAATPSLQRGATIVQAGGTSNTTNVDIGQVTVQTAATDANGVAAAIAQTTKKQITIAQANTGQN